MLSLTCENETGEASNFQLRDIHVVENAPVTLLKVRRYIGDSSLICNWIIYLRRTAEMMRRSETSQVKITFRVWYG